MSVCTCTPKQKDSGRHSKYCTAHMGYALRPPRKKPAPKPVKRIVVGKITVDHDDPGEELPYSVVAEHDAKQTGYIADLAYFSTRKAAHDCAKELRAVLRKKR